MLVSNATGPRAIVEIFGATMSEFKTEMNMLSVCPLQQNKRVHFDKKPPKVRVAKIEPEAESLDIDSDIYGIDEVSGDEILSFLRSGIPEKDLKKLRRGLFDILATLDLHGSTTREAQTLLIQFLNEMQRQGIRAATIVHGKAHLSGGVPVMKNWLNKTLQQITIVKAFCSARSCDGGAGAVYVLINSVHVKTHCAHL